MLTKTKKECRSNGASTRARCMGCLRCLIAHPSEGRPFWNQSWWWRFWNVSLGLIAVFSSKNSRSFLILPRGTRSIEGGFDTKSFTGLSPPNYKNPIFSFSPRTKQEFYTKRPFSGLGKKSQQPQLKKKEEATRKTKTNICWPFDIFRSLPRKRFHRSWCRCRRWGRSGVVATRRIQVDSLVSSRLQITATSLDPLRVV